jgi:hypothetical protein
MEASPVVRRVAFAVIVSGFAALGCYLLAPASHHGDNSSRPPAIAGPVRAAPPARARAAGASSSPPDIYQWLPFTAASLGAAASVVVRFGDAYGTYSYTEDAAAYGASLQPVASAQLVAQVEAAFAAPGVAAARQDARQVAVGTTTIASLRAFGPGSLTLVVQVAQRLTGASGGSEQSSDYAVTVSGSGTTWQVTDVELAAAGNS